MSNEHDEFYKTFCQPAFERIEAKVDGLIKTITVSNGKPSLISRVEDVERLAHQPLAQKTIKEFSLGKGGLKTKGYSGRDMGIILMGVGVFALVVERMGPPAVKFIAGFFA